MTEWTIVLWSAARQIAQEAELPKRLWPEDDIAPQTFFQSLREDEDPAPALSYAASALPKLEAIEWALSCLPELDDAAPDFARRRLLRDAAFRWVGEPDDENRRAMYELADNSESGWPETLIGLAIFFSGGSIAPDDSAPVSADANVCSSFLSGALSIAIANHITDVPDLATRALDLADDLAKRGREALTAT